MPCFTRRGKHHGQAYLLRPRRGNGAVGKHGMRKARGRGGGRPRRTPEGKAALDAAVDRGRRLSDPPLVEARTAARAANLQFARAQQAALDYKRAHMIGQRYRPVYIERIVYVQKKRRTTLTRLIAASADVNVGSFMSEEEQEWLRALVRAEGSTKKGTLFLHDFVSKFAVQFSRTLSIEVMRNCMLALGFNYVRLQPGYHKAGSVDVKNLKRRDLVVPLLLYLYSYKRSVIVWNFDEAAFHVHDFAACAWIDSSVPEDRYKKFIMANNQKGKRITVSAFVSVKYGVLYDDNIQHHVGALNNDNTDQNTTVQIFRWFAAVVSLKYPNDLHVVATDSPAYHSMMPPDACDPSKINLSDGGKNRVEDQLYGNRGLEAIFKFDPGLSGVNTAGFKKEDYQKALWKHAPVKQQKLWLEKILHAKGHVLLFHPVSHPELAPIELLWRDLKFEYRTKTMHTELNLKAFLSKRFSVGDKDEESLGQCKR